MPHTSRKKRPAAPTQKRLQVTDDDGWTHVTSSTNVRRVLRGTRARPDEQVSPSKADAQAQAQGQAQAQAQDPTEAEPALSPAEAPARLTLEELQAQYRSHREKWVNSETWMRLERQLGERIAELGDTSIPRSVPGGPIDAIVCIGLGSPSGFLRGGWVDRRSVSMYQLAALESIAQRVNRSCSHPFPPSWAQPKQPKQNQTLTQTPPYPSTPKTRSSTPSTTPSSTP